MFGFGAKKHKEKKCEIEHVYTRNEQALEISLEIYDGSDYIIVGNILKRADGSRFAADFLMDSEKVDPANDAFDCISIGSDDDYFCNGTNSMRINGGNVSMVSSGKRQVVQMNGYTIGINGSTISIETSKNLEIEVNGVKYLPSGDCDTGKEGEDEGDGYKEIDLQAANVQIGMINIVGSGSISVKKSEDLFNRYDQLSVEIEGSGDANLSDIIIESLQLSVNGSGDIDIKNSVVENCLAEVMGSGDISFDSSCKVAKINASVMGSGDIRGGGISVHKLSKKVMGSGDICGFYSAQQY